MHTRKNNAIYPNRLEFCLIEYKKQRKLEEIISQRQFNRPNVKKWHIALLFCFLPFLLGGVILFSVSLSIVSVYKILVLLLLIAFILEAYVRFGLLLTVKCYQYYAKEETRRRCMCVPSCSEYAIICLKKIFPLLVALIKIRIRLYRTCKGEEYKLDFPTAKMNLEFEQKYLN